VFEVLSIIYLVHDYSQLNKMYVLASRTIEEQVWKRLKSKHYQKHF